jgi:uncharacterized C2H2 Zn-finger protein
MRFLALEITDCTARGVNVFVECPRCSMRRRTSDTLSSWS